jgi:hypothetical protein
MPLRARPPEAVQKRLKMFMFGPAGVGKTTAAIQMPNSYIIDAEKGSENYDAKINASGSVVFHTTHMDDVLQEVRTLLTEKHEYRTLVIDPITTLYNGLLDKCEAEVGSDFGRHYGLANKTMKRLSNLIMQLDMNVCVTAHAKKEYAPGAAMQLLGMTFDGWKSLDYLFDLVVELSKAGKKRFGKVTKTRIETFPDDERFEWSYDAIKERYEKQYGVGVLDREAIALALAAPEQVREVRELLNIVKLPDGLADKWLAKAQADRWEDMPADAIAKCIDYIRNRMTAEVPV